MPIAIVYRVYLAKHHITLDYYDDCWIPHTMPQWPQVISDHAQTLPHIPYRHLIPAPVDWTSVSVCLYKDPCIICQKGLPSTAMTLVACGSNLRSVVRSSTHPCPGNWEAIGRAVVYNARAAHPFTAGIKCQHCRWLVFVLSVEVVCINGSRMKLMYSKAFEFLMTWIVNLFVLRVPLESIIWKLNNKIAYVELEILSGRELSANWMPGHSM